jgi:DNA-binding CsgD family transcriptional regulator
MVDSLETVLARDNQAPSQRLETLILHGNTLKRLGNTLHFAKAVKSYEAAMVLAEQLGLPRRAAEAQLQLGFLFEMTDSHQPEAEFNCTQARKRFSELNDSSGVARACYCLAAVADKAKRYEEAMGLARQAIAYAQGNPEQPRYMLILGRILDNQRRGREAWAVYQQALQNQNLDADTRTDLFYEIMWHGNRTDNPQLSLEFAQKWKNSIDTTNMVFMTQYHDIMAKGLYRLGDYQQAGYHQTMRFETYKVLTLNDQQQQLADARAHFQATLAEQEAALLLQRLESRNIVVLSVILGALLLAAVAVALWIINRRNRLLFTQQQRLADSENALLEQRLALGELERERVVRENERLAVEQALAEARQRQLELDLQLKEQDAEIKSQRLKAELHAAAERLLERRSVMAELSEKLEDVLEDGSRQRNEKLRSLLRTLRQGATEPEDDERIQAYLMHTQGDFFANLLQRHPHLSQAELRLAALLRIDKTSKDIAFLTNTTPDSVNTARSRLRKKLDLPKEQDLVAYLKGIGSGAHNLGPEHSNWELDSAAINLPQLSPPE